MPPNTVLYIGTDNMLYLLGLHDVVSGAFITTATVTVQLLDATGTQVVSPLTLENVPDPLTVNGTTYEDGNYLGKLKADAPLAEADYQAIVTAVDSSGTTLTKEVSIPAIYDGLA